MDSGYRRLPYLPALDGLRGVMLVAIFMYHAGYPDFAGGVVGISVFFTMSGFLITRLLLDEAFMKRAIDVGKFFARRLRRLMPAAIITIVLVLVLSATVLHSDPSRFRTDVLWTLFYGANWRFIFDGRSYAHLFDAPSPLQHFWSLAIEEQFYLIFPVFMAVLVKWSARGGRLIANLRWILWCGIAASVVTTIVMAGNNDFVYYSLPTHAAEILMGALLATSFTAARLVDAPAPRWVNILGFGTLLTMAGLYAVSGPNSDWVLSGGLPAFSVVSAVLIFCLLPNGPLSRLFAFLPFRSLGKISYGVYLYHWPIILWLTPQRTGLGRLALTGLQIVTTLTFAIVSYVYIEKPIRYGRLLRTRRVPYLVPTVFASMVALTVFVTSTLTQPNLVNFAAAAEGVRHTVADAPATATHAGANAPPRVAFFGDSTALLTSYGTLQWGKDTGRMVPVAGATWLGCGIIEGGLARNPIEHFVAPTREGCQDWTVEWPKAVTDNATDIAVVMSTVDIGDHQLAGDKLWRAPGDPVYDAMLKQEMLAVVDSLSSRGAQVVWVAIPHIDVDIQKVPKPAVPSPEDNPARIDRFNEILREVAKDRPQMRIVDLGRWIRSRPEGEFDQELRPDGLHFSLESTGVVAKWLGPAILRAARTDTAAGNGTSRVAKAP